MVINQDHTKLGISTGFIPDALDTKSYDSVVRIPLMKLSQHHVHWVAKKVSAGISSGAAIADALKVAAELYEGQKF